MVIMLLETTELAKRTQVQVLEVLLGFLQDKITKTEVLAVQTATPLPPHHHHHPLQPPPPTTFAFSTPPPIAHRRS